MTESLVLRRLARIHLLSDKGLTVRKKVPRYLQKRRAAKAAIYQKLSDKLQAICDKVNARQPLTWEEYQLLKKYTERKPNE